MDPITQKLVPGAAGFIPNHYVDEVFSVDTWLGQGTGTSLTPRDKKITNGINMAEHGGMVWNMQRAVSGANGSDCYKTISDTDIGVQKRFFATSSDGAMGTQADAMQSFDSDGWTMGTNMFMNEGMNDNSNSSSNLAYTFRKQPGFFDMVTFTTGDGGNPKQQNKRINHSLECKPGFWIMKNQTNNGDYYVYHKVQGRSQYAKMNEGGAFSGDSDFWGQADPTTTDFGVNETAPWWVANSTYSVWMWADGDDADAKLFGVGKDSEIVKQVVVNGNNVLTDVGWEPQMLLVMADGDNCFWFDYLRGWSAETENGMYSPYHAGAITSNTYAVETTNYAQGANVKGWFNGNFSGQQYCLAIRRPDAKVGKWAKTPNECIHLYKGQSPEAHTFDLHNFVDSSGNQTGFGVQDMEFSMRRYDEASQTPVFMTTNRLMSGSTNSQGGRDTGVSSGYSRYYLSMNDNDYLSNNPAQLRNIRYDLNSEMYDPTQGNSNTYGSYIPQYSFGNDSSFKNTDSIFYMFKRKPGFFDMIKYKGAGSFVQPGLTHTPHALGVKPDLVIAKSIGNNTNYGSYGNYWGVWSRAAAVDGIHDERYNTCWINTSIIGTRYMMWGDMIADSITTETVRIQQGLFNQSGVDGHFMYLFANCEGVFHTGIYTGAGEGTPVDVTEIGFSPRVLMLRNISSTGAWWVWDTLRGFSSDNDPYLRWNSPARQVSDTDYVDPLSNGFQITNTAPGNSSLKLNVSGEKVLYLAFA